MKRWTKITLLASTACMIAGFVLAIPAHLAGAANYVYLMNNRIVLPEALSEDTAHTVTEETMAPFTSIDVNAAADITVIPSDHYGLEITYYKEEIPITYLLENGTLRVAAEGTLSSYTNGRTFSGSSLGFFSYGGVEGFGFGGMVWGEQTASQYRDTVKIYVPEKEAYEDIRLNTSIGACSLSKLSAKNAEVRSSFGKISLDGVQAGTLTVDMENGSLTVKDVETASFSVKNNFGVTDIAGVKATESMEWEAENGRFTISNVEAPTLYTKNNFGSTEISNAKAKERIECEGEKNKLELTSVSAAFLKLKNTFGSIHLQDGTFSGTEIEMENGPCRLENSALGTLTLTNNFGSVDGSGISASDIQLNAENAKITLDGLFTGHSNLENNFGSVVINNQLSRSLCGMDLASNFGSITVEDQKIERDGGSTIRSFTENTGGKNLLEIRNENGSINLTFGSMIPDASSAPREE